MLLWLLNNYNSEKKDLRLASTFLLCKLTGIVFNKDIKISSLETYAQYKKIDILVKCVINGFSHVIAIEDKVDSTDHGNQLNRYRKLVLDDFEHYHNKSFTFFKASILTANEVKHVKNCCWNVMDIKDIYELFLNLDVDIENYLLKSYIDYIEDSYNKLTKALPQNITNWDKKHWYNFSINHHWRLSKNISTVFSNYRNLYYVFAFNLESKWNSLPYLEFRSRDLINGTFNIRILLYHIDTKLIHNHIQIWKEKINKSKLFKVQNYKKQIGINKIKDSFNSVEELERIAIKYIEEFYKIIQ